MEAYKKYASEKRIFKDRVSQVTITQLTSYLGHSFHTYFNNNGWYENNKKLLFTSDRENVSNLCSIDLESGIISQLTDFASGSRRNVFFKNDINHKKNETYYTLDDKVYAISLDTLECRELLQVPEGFKFSLGLVGAEGLYVYGVLQEDLSSRIYTNLNAGYVGMRDMFAAHPDCRIVRINVETNKLETIFQENNWIGHVNPSPTQPDLMTFCHEGPWAQVDHRIWVLDLKQGTPYKLCERREKGEKIGHEYWHKDGIHVGYQLHKPDGSSSFGMIRYDGENIQEAECIPFPSPDHIHSNDFQRIVSDSGKSIKVYAFNGNDFDKARVLAMHDGSFFYGTHHPHPRVSEDGKTVLYNSNASGYCQMYLAEIPDDITTLPFLKEE